MQGDTETEAVPTQYTITFPGSEAQGLLAVGHLADSATAVAELRSAIQVGDQLGDLLVLERLEVRDCCGGTIQGAFLAHSMLPYQATGENVQAMLGCQLQLL